MDLTELKTNEFLRLLASDSPAPGGGAASALAGCLGCALVEMVVSLTKGRQRYEEFETLMAEISDKAADLRNKLSEAVTRDAEAFNLVTDAYKMEKQTEEQKQQRKAAIQDALKKASDVPLALMKLTSDTILLCESAVGKSNPNAAGDLTVSAILLKAAAHGAYINVRANLAEIDDGAFCESRGSESARIFAEINRAADRICNGS